MQYSMDIVAGAREITARMKVTLEERQGALDSVSTAIKSTGPTSERNTTKDLANSGTMGDILELYNAVAKLDL